MATLDLSAGDNVHADTNLKITSNLSSPATVYMDVIGGEAGEVPAGTFIPLINTGTAIVTVLSMSGHMVGRVAPKTSAWLAAGADGNWRMLPGAPTSFEPAANIEVPSTGSTKDEEARAVLEDVIEALVNAGIVLPAAES